MDKNIAGILMIRNDDPVSMYAAKLILLLQKEKDQREMMAQMEEDYYTEQMHRDA